MQPLSGLLVVDFTTLLPGPLATLMLAEAGAEVIKIADILVEQFRPGVMTRLGLGYEDVRALNPHLIYCSISGYGQSGPRVHEAGHDINYIGNTGLLDLQPGPREHPVIPPMLAADIAGG